MHSLIRRAWVEVDLGALLRNGAAIATRARRPAAADGEGGRATVLGRCASRARSSGSTRGASASRRSPKAKSSGAPAITRPIVVFTPVLVGDFDAAIRADLTPTLGDARAIERWQRDAAALASRDRHGNESRRHPVERDRSSFAMCSPRPRAAGRVHALSFRRARTTTRASSRSGGSPTRSPRFRCVRR